MSGMNARLLEKGMFIGTHIEGLWASIQQVSLLEDQMVIDSPTELRFLVSYRGEVSWVKVNMEFIETHEVRSMKLFFKKNKLKSKMKPGKKIVIDMEGIRICDGLEDIFDQLNELRAVH